MTRVHIFVEGQTEETFVRELLQYPFSRLGIYLNPILFRTSSQGKGGAVSYGKIKWQIEKKCKEDPSAYVTTMLDVYGLPKEFPGKIEAEKKADIREKVVYLEEAFAGDIGQRRFIPNLLLHEFEALLFTSPTSFDEWFGKKAAQKLNEIRDSFDTPEHIDDGPETAPSKRIEKICPGYEKPVHGSLIAMDIQLVNIRRECRHFDQWLTKLEKLN